MPEKAKPDPVRRAESAAAPKARPGTVVAPKPDAAPRPKPAGHAPVAGAVQGPLPDSQKPELATLVEEPPEGDGWLSEVKFDGYRLLVRKHGRDVRLITRNGLDWSTKLPDITRAIARLKPDRLLLDGELVALRPDGLSSFAALQAALSEGGHRGGLFFYGFDLLHLDGWDLRGCRLADRKAALRSLDSWHGALRFSDHLEGETPRVRRQACAMGLEGIICKRADAPYRGTRTRDWVKVKCQGRDEFIILGWTPPAGSRQGLGSLHLGFHDESGRLHYVGGVGTGFTEKELVSLRRRLGRLASTPPEGLLLAGDPPDPAINWVQPALVGEVQYIGWTGFGRLRHATWLGLREDKGAEEVVRDIPHPEAARMPYQSKAPAAGRIVHAPKPVRGAQRVGGTEITHADRELWPGITKQDLAEYWTKVARRALPGIAGRPLALLRCPDGIAGQGFFQKHGNRGMPPAIAEGNAEDQPYLSHPRRGRAVGLRADGGDRAARLGRDARRPRLPRPDRARPRPRRGCRLPRGGQGRARPAPAAAGHGPGQLLPHHRRQGAARGGAATARGRLGKRCAISPMASPGRWRRRSRDASSPPCPRRSGAVASWWTGCATASAPPPSVPTRRAPGPAPRWRRRSPGGR